LLQFAAQCNRRALSELPSDLAQELADGLTGQLRELNTRGRT
jgi:hypothetical protein